MLSVLETSCNENKCCTHDSDVCQFEDGKVAIFSEEFNKVYLIVEKRELIIIKRPRHVAPFESIPGIRITIKEFPNMMSGLKKIMSSTIFVE